MAAEVIARLVVELDQRIWVTGKGRALAHGARNRSTDVNGAKPRPGTERGLRSATLARGVTWSLPSLPAPAEGAGGAAHHPRGGKRPSGAIRSSAHRAGRTPSCNQTGDHNIPSEYIRYSGACCDSFLSLALCLEKFSHWTLQRAVTAWFSMKLCSRDIANF
jgi:hypothetical protein